MPAHFAVDPPEEGRPYALISGDGESLSDLPAALLEDTFKRYGAFLARGFAADLDAFRRVSDALCTTWVVNEAGGREMIDVDAHIQSVNTGFNPFPLHAEISRSPWRPDACLFYCLEPPRFEGETTVCDGVALAAALPADLSARLASRRLLFAHNAGPDDLILWFGTASPTPEQLRTPPIGCPFAFERHGEHVVARFSRPFLHQPMFTDAPAFANFLLFARDMRHNRRNPLLDDGTIIPDRWVDTIRATSDRLTAAIRWQPGDLLVLDNSRFMHGRRRVIPGARRIASRFGYLRFAPANPEEPPDPIWRRDDFTPPGV